MKGVIPVDAVSMLTLPIFKGNEVWGFLGCPGSHDLSKISSMDIEILKISVRLIESRLAQEGRKKPIEQLTEKENSEQDPELMEGIDDQQTQVMDQTNQFILKRRN